MKERLGVCRTGVGHGEFEQAPPKKVLVAVVVLVRVCFHLPLAGHYLSSDSW